VPKHSHRCADRASVCHRAEDFSKTRGGRREAIAGRSAAGDEGRSRRDSDRSGCARVCHAPHRRHRRGRVGRPGDPTRRCGWGTQAVGRDPVGRTAPTLALTPGTDGWG
jgi:hypothetical protein